MYKKLFIIFTSLLFLIAQGCTNNSYQNNKDLSLPYNFNNPKEDKNIHSQSNNGLGVQSSYYNNYGQNNQSISDVGASFDAAIGGDNGY